MVVIAIPAIPSNIQNWVQVFAWVAAVIGVVVAAFKAINELAQNRRLRAEELRWKKAQLAREVLTGFSGKRVYRDALTMLDWTGRNFETAPGHFEKITWGDLIVALRPSEDPPFSSKEVYIRDCFDELSDAMALVEHYLRTDLLEFGDVEFPMKYYVGKLRQPGMPVPEFMRHYGYDLALHFLERFPP